MSDSIKAFEYKTEYMSNAHVRGVHRRLLDERLKELGSEGWELCAIGNIAGSELYYFKREISPYE